MPILVIACVLITRADAANDAAVLRALKETGQSVAIYGTELDRRQALADAQVQEGIRSRAIGPHL